ncbi:MAG: oligosaccharide flippase family protein, partial [Flavobacteriales bacterium]
MRKTTRMGAINKTFVSNLLMLIGVNLLIKPFYLLIIEAQVQERIGAENFGLYFALLNISFILNILPDLGITNWNNRNIAQQGIIHRTELYKLLRLRLILGGIYIAACLIVGFLLNYDNSSVTMLIVLAFNQVLATGILFFRSYLSGMHRFAADRIISISDRILLILLLGGALITTSEEEAFPIDYLIYGQTTAYALTLLLAFIFVKRFSSHEITERSSNTSSILSSSLPFATLILVSMMSSRIDSIMLERMGGSFQAGIYAMSFRLGDMLTMISYLFAVMLLPIFSRLLAQQKNPAELFGIAFRMLLVGCTSIVALCVLNPSWILSIIYDQHIEEASLILP